MRTLRIRAAATLALAAATLGFAASGEAQKPPKAGSVSLKSSADTVTFSAPVTLTGSVKGAKAGVAVSLERRAATSATFVPAAMATTNAHGDFSFVQRPAVNTVYRVLAASTPPAQSQDVSTSVRPLVGLRVGDTTPRRGQRVPSRGPAPPPHDGMRVAIQRRRADGTWLTVAAPRLRDAGSVYSRYRKLLRIRRTGTYRTVLAAHAAHAEG